MKPPEEDRIIFETLREAVREALERKRRLGQYAVVWESGHPVFIGPNPPTGAHRYATEPSRPCVHPAAMDEFGMAHGKQGSRLDLRKL